MIFVAIVVTVICPPFGAIASLYGIKKDKKNALSYSLIIALVLGVFAFNYQPAGGTDLIRYFENVETISQKPWSIILKSFISGKDSLYIYTTECWIIGRYFNIHLLPALSVFGVYFCSFYITCKIGEKMNVSGGTIAIYIIFTIFAVNFYYVVNNVRNVVSFMMISIAVFREFYLKKRNVITIVFYLLPLFIHTSAVVFILLRLSIPFIKKIRLLSLCAVFAVEPLLMILNRIFSSLSSTNFVIKMIARMISKGADYFMHTTSHWAIIASNSGSIKYTKISYEILTLVFSVFYFIIVCSKKKKMKYSCEANWNDYVYCIILATCSMFPMVMPEYWRFAVCIILSGSSMYYLDKFINNSLFMKISIWIGVIILCLWCRDVVINSDWKYMIVHSFFPIL